MSLADGEAHQPRDYVVFDLEATGLSAKTDRILEVGAIRYDSEMRRLADLEVLVDPGMPIPLAVQRLVGITPDQVLGAPSPSEAVAQLADFCAGADLVTHGGAFDMQFAEALAPDAFRNRLVFDTLDLARILLPSVETHGLQHLSRELGLPHERPHRALSDAEATGALFAWLLQRARRLPPDVIGQLRRVAAPAGPALTTFFERVASMPVPANADGVRGAGHLTSGPAIARAAGAPEVNGTRNALATLPLDDAAAAALSPGGAFDTGDGYEYRESQVQMARAVAQSLDRGRRLLIEAGTGVGKSLAYLVPLALWTTRHGQRAVVATHTVALQEQLADRELPRLAAVADPPPRTAVLKGRNHYISLRRWARFLAQPELPHGGADLTAVRFTLKLTVWLTETSSG